VLVALEFHYRDPVPGASQHSGRIALFPGAFNPPTIAHLAIARAARQWAGEVVWTLPRAFPHKAFEGAPFEVRLAMLRRLLQSEPGFSLAIASGGLYVEMADEARDFFGPGVDIGLLCGRDAAERIASWDYGTPGVFEAMIERYSLLVAGRAGSLYLPLPHHAERIICLTMDPAFDAVSSTEVRRRLESGQTWRHLVPEPVAEMVASAYAA
jgi:nicotinate (nicotinamide) nucleotide adenylyltransferase